MTVDRSFYRLYEFPNDVPEDEFCPKYVGPWAFPNEMLPDFSDFDGTYVYYVTETGIRAPVGSPPSFDEANRHPPQGEIWRSLWPSGTGTEVLYTTPSPGSYEYDRHPYFGGGTQTVQPDNTTTELTLDDSGNLYFLEKTGDAGEGELGPWLVSLKRISKNGGGATTIYQWGSEFVGYHPTVEGVYFGSPTGPFYDIFGLVFNPARGSLFLTQQILSSQDIPGPRTKESILIEVSTGGSIVGSWTVYNGPLDLTGPAFPSRGATLTVGYDGIVWALVEGPSSEIQTPLVASFVPGSGTPTVHSHTDLDGTSIYWPIAPTHAAGGGKVYHPTPYADSVTEDTFLYFPDLFYPGVFTTYTDTSFEQVPCNRPEISLLGGIAYYFGATSGFTRTAFVMVGLEPILDVTVGWVLGHVHIPNFLAEG